MRKTRRVFIKSIYAWWRQNKTDRRTHLKQLLLGSATALLICLAPFVAAHAEAIAADRPPSAAVATAHPLATAAGRFALEHGGNAFDAAIAITAALAVVEPTGSGLGGGGFFLLHRYDDNKDVFIDARETAPGAATADMYLDREHNPIKGASIDGPLAAGIPGIPAAINQLATHYGQLPLRETLRPAIQAAEDGFAIEEHYIKLATFRADALRKSPAAAAIFLDGGNVPAPGFVLKQADLAKVLRTLTRDDHAFYQGDIAQQLVSGARAAGGIWSLDDLRNYRAKEREPLRGKFGDINIITAPPPSSGGTVLLTSLNILAGFQTAKLDPATTIHTEIEAMRRAYRDRALYLGDPDFVTIPTAQLIHPFYAEGLRAGIRLDRATPSATLPGTPGPPQGTQTTHFSVIDQYGNWVAATLSVNLPFGSGFVAPGTGILLNNEMDDFSIKPGTPNAYGLVGDAANAIAPGKRPLSSMTPTFLVSGDRVGILGTPGGSRIISMVLIGALQFAAGTPVENWVTQRRFHHQFLPDVTTYEKGAFDEATVQQLTKLGHALKLSERDYGNMQAVLWDRRNNAVTAASDPRGIGTSNVFIQPGIIIDSTTVASRQQH